MKKHLKLVIIMSIIILMYFIPSLSYGATSYVSSSNTSVNEGDTFTITAGGNAASWNITLNYSGPVSLVSGNLKSANTTESGENENSTFVTATFKATGEGTAIFNLKRTTSKWRLFACNSHR